jgi:hypothetical protein
VLGDSGEDARAELLVVMKSEDEVRLIREGNSRQREVFPLDKREEAELTN